MRRGLIAVFARHGLLANLLMILIFVAGGLALARMNIQFFPSFALDVISVRVVWSGASAEDVENGINHRKLAPRHREHGRARLNRPDAVRRRPEGFDGPRRPHRWG